MDFDFESVTTFLCAFTIPFVFFFLLSLCSSKQKKETPTEKVISEVEFSGTWESKIYDDESGKFTINILNKGFDETVTSQTAKVTLNYSSKSKYRKNGKNMFECECTENLYMYYLRQKEFNSKQYFTLTIAKKKGTSSYLTSIDPHDLVELKFDDPVV